jgi:DNA polymerase-1
VIHVGGDGPQDAQLVIVGEAPGAEEELRRKPFVGGAGQLLTRMLTAAGLYRDTLYITNVVKVRPPANQLSRLHELGVSVNDFIPELVDELNRIRPKVVVALGDLACRTLTGKQPITKWRGSVLPCTLVSGPLVVPTLHPAYILRDYVMHPAVIADLQKAKRVLNGQYAPEGYDIIVNPTIVQIEDYIAKCLDNRAVAFDIETTAVGIRCLGLSCEADSALVIPVCRMQIADRENMWRLVRLLFENEQVTKIGQNMSFDLSFLVPHVGFPRPPLFDTMLAHHLLVPELPHDLDFLASIYADMNYYAIKPWESDDHDTWIYNGRDCIATFRTYEKLSQELKESHMNEFFEGYTMPLFMCLFEMQHRGVRIDSNRREQLRQLLVAEICRLQIAINAASGRELNPNSPKQLKEYFYEEQRHTQRVHRKRGTVTVDKEALGKLAAEGSQVAQLILQYRQAQKLLSTFVDIPLSPSGCIHSEYVISGTVTGRLSSRTPFTGFGSNLQNIPPQARELIVPRPGMCFVKGDLSQAENRVVAWLTDGIMKKAFQRGDDVHSLAASMLFGGQAQDYPKGSHERNVAKTCVHAANYGSGPGQVAAILHCTQSEARKLLEKYHESFPEVRRWHERIRARLAKNRTLVTPLGRKRQFLGRWGDELFRSAYAFIPQSTVADYLNLGLLRLWLKLFPLNSWPVLQVHDEVVVECPIGQEQQVEQIMRQCLEIPIVVESDILVIPLETKVLYEHWV